MVVVVAVVGAVWLRLLVVVVAGGRAAVETEDYTVSCGMGSTAEPSDSASPWGSSIGLCSTGVDSGSIEEMLDAWLLVL